MTKRSLKPTNGDQLEGVSAHTRSISESSPQVQLDEQDVADLAYQRWVERGCPQGSADLDWLEAERELRSRSPVS